MRDEAPIGRNNYSNGLDALVPMVSQAPAPTSPSPADFLSLNATSNPPRCGSIPHDSPELRELSGYNHPTATRRYGFYTSLIGTWWPIFICFDPMLNYHAILNKYIVGLEGTSSMMSPFWWATPKKEDAIDLSLIYTGVEDDSAINWTCGPYAAALPAANPANNDTAAIDAYNSTIIIRSGYYTST
ncbi:hypothetical protein BO70DRAFT_433072 [Aspergillus heteromorphus CBS 117.55]|uniref:Uncharacterized protein n=1 Tax=Aspergillus heteromorphus CBS 117.55 TaxID=1448321 RepID=A0A317UYC4_9EURO|nr:uncharacterized protein BO70DRAFT_433072 [Aspergillus heteromorphus CBS 117.55]PWY66755.1 hypothetical protein BO70DRAFT_433072 [Aspergillus heteromorphus CBS 117.55]